MQRYARFRNPTIPKNGDCNNQLNLSVIYGVIIAGLPTFVHLINTGIGRCRNGDDSELIRR